MKDLLSDDIMAVLTSDDKAKAIARIREELPEDGASRDEYTRSILKFVMGRDDQELAIAVVHRSSAEALTTEDAFGNSPIKTAIAKNNDRELVEAMAAVIGEERMKQYSDNLQVFMKLDVSQLFRDATQAMNPIPSQQKGRSLPTGN